MYKSVLNAPLPRIYEMSDKGPIPVEKSTMIVGTGVNFEGLMGSAGDLKAKLQQEVGRALGRTGPTGFRVGWLCS